MDKALAMKIYNVMCATEALEKTTTVGKNTKGEYKAIGEKDVLNMMKPLFKLSKLIIMPVEGDITEHVDKTIAYAKEGTRSVTQLKVYFDIIDAETGESTRIVGFGNGADSQDKGSGKAFTYALKTALQKSFLLFSGEDTDNTHSDEITESTQGEPERKVSTKELTDLAKQKHVPLTQIFEMYKTDTGKTTDDIKWLKGEYKVKYFDMLTEMPDKQ